jgi:hypothetical protein
MIYSGLHVGAPVSSILLALGVRRQSLSRKASDRVDAGASDLQAKEMPPTRLSSRSNNLGSMACPQYRSLRRERVIAYPFDPVLEISAHIFEA